MQGVYSVQTYLHTFKGLPVFGLVEPSKDQREALEQTQAFEVEPKAIGSASGDIKTCRPENAIFWTVYGRRPWQPSSGEVQWLAVALDDCATEAEALQRANLYALMRGGLPVVSNYASTSLI